MILQRKARDISLWQNLVLFASRSKMYTKTKCRTSLEFWTYLELVRERLWPLGVLGIAEYIRRFFALYKNPYSYTISKECVVHCWVIWLSVISFLDTNAQCPIRTFHDDLPVMKQVSDSISMWLDPSSVNLRHGLENSNFLLGGLGYIIIDHISGKSLKVV